MSVPWVGPVVAVLKGLWDIVSEAIGADQKKLDELGERVGVVLSEGTDALRLARVASASDDKLTAVARDLALERVRAAGRGILLVTHAVPVTEDDPDKEP